MRAAVLLALAACSSARADRPEPSEEAGKRAFLTVHRVLLDPRCMNCHPQGDAPLQYDDSRPHGMNITRRSEANGLPCATCHRTRNGTRPGQPPGAPNWHLPPAAHPMVFEGRTPAQLCAQLKDPDATAGRDLPAILHHVSEDPLVHWGWAPGPGRRPIAVPRDVFLAAMRTWIDAGAPCP